MAPIESSQRKLIEMRTLDMNELDFASGGRGFPRHPPVHGASTPEQRKNANKTLGLGALGFVGGGLTGGLFGALVWGTVGLASGMISNS